jgi:DNA-binding transcriptional MerR regulator/methylmalonyl-CoA mutase cobalamin-binding subunit
MTVSREGPYFNLKAVVKQTGLKPDTLRAWERRYGLPTPERSSGGHRLYTRHDIEALKWLMGRQKEGLTIGRAVDLWRQLESEGQDPLAAPGIGVAVTPAPQPSPAPGAKLDELRENWISACLAYDERRSEQVLAQAFSLYSPETVGLRLLQTSVSEIGERWYRGEVTVQQEHFCSALVNRRLEAMIMASPPPTRPGRILTACPPREQHVFSLLLLTFLLRRRGWDVIYLGANVPAERLETTVGAARPQLVVMAAQQLHSAASLLEVARVLRVEGVPLAYGGLIFNLVPELRARVPGHFLGERLDLAAEAVEAQMVAPRPVPETEPIPAALMLARDHFEERRGLIEADLIRAIRPETVDPARLSFANQELASNITAVLALGDMKYLGTDIDWVKGLLANHDLPVESLREYLSLYLEYAEQHMDGRAEPIVDWLQSVTRDNGFGGVEGGD